MRWCCKVDEELDGRLFILLSCNCLTTRFPERRVRLRASCHCENTGRFCCQTYESLEALHVLCLGVVTSQLPTKITIFIPSFCNCHATIPDRPVEIWRRVISKILPGRRTTELKLRFLPLCNYSAIVRASRRELLEQLYECLSLSTSPASIVQTNEERS